jgi:type II secretory pathway pseudopilin PulG
VIVIVIIGIIAAIAIPRVSRGANKAEEHATKASLQAVRKAIEMYTADNGSFPCRGNGNPFEADFRNAMLDPAHGGPYLHAIPVLTLAIHPQSGESTVAVHHGVTAPAPDPGTAWRYGYDSTASVWFFFVNHAAPFCNW